MKEALAAYIKRVRELVEHVRDSEQATKLSLIGPLFTLLGYDMTDPRVSAHDRLQQDAQDELQHGRRGLEERVFIAGSGRSEDVVDCGAIALQGMAQG